MNPHKELPDAEVDVLIDAVLTASGSGMRHFTVQRTIDRMRAAMREAVAKACRANQAADAVPVALTDDQINDVAINYAVHVAADIYDIRRYDCAEDFYNCVRKCVELAHPSPTTAPASESIRPCALRGTGKCACPTACQQDMEARNPTSKPVAASDGSFPWGVDLPDVFANVSRVLERHDQDYLAEMYRSEVDKLAAQVAASKPAEVSQERRDAIHRKVLAMPDGPDYIGPAFEPAAASGKAVAWMIWDAFSNKPLRTVYTASEASEYAPQHVRPMVYATPPAQAPALPATGEALTDDEILRIGAPYLSDDQGFARKPELFEIVAFARAIIAALKGGV